MAAPARLLRLSRTMSAVTTVTLALVVGLMIAAVLIPAWLHNLALARLGTSAAAAAFDPANRLAAAVVLAVPIGVLAWGLWQVRALFRAFAAGRVFTPEAATRLRRFGWAVLAQAPLGPLSATGLGFALTYANPPGQRMLVVALSVNDIVALVVGGLLVAIAAAMREAARLADENAAFV